MHCEATHMNPKLFSNNTCLLFPLSFWTEEYPLVVVYFFFSMLSSVPYACVSISLLSSPFIVRISFSLLNWA